MTTHHVFVTGAAGCVGHYVLRELLKNPDIHIHALVRFPKNVMISDPRITLYEGNLEELAPHQDVLSTVSYIVHIATTWIGEEACRKVNIESAHVLLSYTNPHVFKKMLYFSTASILGQDNKPIEEAGKFGTTYIRTKHEAFFKLKNSAYADKIVTVFPTLVIGGDKTFPKSHITEGLVPNSKYLNALKFFDCDGAFHFLHAQDIATVSLHLMFHSEGGKDYVLGQPKVTFREAIDTLCVAFGKSKAPFRFLLTPKRVFRICKWLRIYIGPWERYCIEHPQMVYTTVNPQTFGLPTAFPAFRDIVEDIKSVSN